MLIRYLAIGLVGLSLGCGTASQVINVTKISQPLIAGLGFDQSCLGAETPDVRCKGDRVVVRGSRDDAEVVRHIQSEVQAARFHQIVDESDPSLTVRVDVSSNPPNYTVRRTQQHFPRQCIEQKEECRSSRELRACLVRANKAADSRTRERLKSGCRQRHRRCKLVCVSFREAYTNYTVDEVCNGAIKIDVVRFMDREGNAVGSESGLLLGSPTLTGSSISSRTEKGYLPSPAGEAQLCGSAFGNAVKKVRQQLNPFEVTLQMVFADLSLAPYQGALNQIRFGRFQSAHRELNEAFNSASAVGIASEDVAWIHHAKAAVFYLQGQKTECAAQLQHATRLKPSLLRGSEQTAYGYTSPEGDFQRLMKQCVH